MWHSWHTDRDMYRDRKMWEEDIKAIKRGETRYASVGFLGIWLAIFIFCLPAGLIFGWLIYAVFGWQGLVICALPFIGLIIDILGN